jgi:hypothetical protein
VLSAAFSARLFSRYTNPSSIRTSASRFDPKFGTRCKVSAFWFRCSESRRFAFRYWIRARAVGRSAAGAAVGVAETAQVIHLGNLSHFS